MIENKAVLGMMLTLLLIATSTLAFNTQPSIARAPVLNINTDEGFATIQAAIDDPDTLNGHTILVNAGTYYEHVNVTKPLSLIGENPVTTIIDGSGTGIVVSVKAPDVEIEGFTIQNAGSSIIDFGIYLANCTEKISNNLIKNNAYGIELFKSNGSMIMGNIITNNSWAGVHIRDSNGNTFHGNTITNNSMGVHVATSTVSRNTFYHNNLINNPNQASDFGPSKWDKGAEGNYWSDYAGEDLDRDGIGDTLLPHGVDQYPLMSPYMEGDINHDAVVNVLDGVIVAIAFGAKPNDPNWNRHADLNEDEIINILDIIIWATHFGETL